MALLNEGNTVPFIARYRKEATGSLDEVAIRSIEERATYFKELLERRETVVKSIDKAGKLTPELTAKIENAWTKTELEDLYLPYKPKKRTKATVAKELGLESLLNELLADDSGADPLMLSSPYVSEDSEGLQTPSICMEGAGYILAERLAENSDVRAWLRQEFFDHGTITTLLREERKDGQEALRFKPYWDYKEPIRKAPTHRVLAIRRGEKEEILQVKLVTDRERLVTALVSRVEINPKSGYRASLHSVCEDAFDRLLAPTLETDVRIEAKKRADVEAIKVFQTNLDHLLLAPPAGQMCTLGIDPGIRTGCKMVIINRLGQFMEAVTVYPLEPKKDLDGTWAVLDELATKYPIEAIAIGDGTGGRETEAVIHQWLSNTGRETIACVSVSEAGASVYSASEVAREEFPDLDVTVRGAISIARRFQDPLAELVKVEPRSIGVGQYQHDVNQSQLKKGLDDSVESSVNRVGVDLNSASYKLLSYVAGIGESLAKNIVQWRYEKGAFQKREQLLDVPRFGEKAFQQSAGFLRIRGGENPLDASAVHPESYPVVERICQSVGKTISELLGNESVLDSLDPSSFTDDNFGIETVADIIAEFKKPGRDPRQKFEVVHFNEGIRKPSDLEVGMELQGVVTNVTDFGAFVNIGVHQDGLVHLSEIGHTFIKHPSDALSVGQPIKVKVMTIDFDAKRIGLSIKALLEPPARNPTPRRPPKQQPGQPRRHPKAQHKLPTATEKVVKPDKVAKEGSTRMALPKPPEKTKASRPKAKREMEQAVNTTPPSSATLDELMAKFNRGLR
ncbi:MAG: helix-hairpin-helix domain-containing protein [Holophagaceae bacterium]|nr:helix-hairpin-helix domain-containing protein [Holophagaceae bacterium]